MSLVAAFRFGSSGIYIKDLQARLSIRRDGIFGDETRMKVRHAQQTFGLDPTGDADKETYKALTLSWPSQFERCLNLTCCFEGTEYGDMNNIDIDGAGITLGIIGFTSKHGEVQALIRSYLKANPTAYDALTESRQADFRRLARPDSKAAEWEDVFYGPDGRIRQDIKAAVRVWGEDPEFRALQRSVARDSFWIKAIKDAQSLGLESMAGYGLMFDIAVQNGGWASRHAVEYAKMPRPRGESERLRAIANVVANKANPRWKNDVLKRKMVFAEGAGKVHGRYYDLQSMAFENV